MPTNIGQIRAKAAWGFAQGKSKEYGQYVKKFPMYIKTNGLVNAVAFAYSKRGKPNKPKNEWEQLYDDIQTYFEVHDPNENIKGLLSQKKSLMAVLVEDVSDEQLRTITAETLALFTWLKRFVSND